MEQEILRLGQVIADLQRDMDTLRQELRAPIKIENLLGLFRTISDSTEFARATTVADRVPSSFGEQILIYNNAGTYKLYVYDSVGKVWKNVTIA